MKLQLTEVVRAHSKVAAQREMYVILPAEEYQEGQYLYGELREAMYGTRDAVQHWELEC